MLFKISDQYKERSIVHLEVSYHFFLIHGSFYNHMKNILVEVIVPHHVAFRIEKLMKIWSTLNLHVLIASSLLKA